MTTLIDNSRNPNLGSKVHLYQIDLSIFGEESLYLYEGNEGQLPITYDEIEYSPWSMQSSGFEHTTEGSLPRPNITLANVSGMFTPLIENNDDLKGAKVTRIVTWERFLDDGDDPDPSMHYPPDVFIVNRKTSHVLDRSVSFELVSAIDLENVELPSRIVVREYCDFDVRKWNSTTEEFEYTNVTCPFADEELLLDIDGESVSDEEDEVFSKKFTTCCKPRFGSGPYPFGGFPGVARYKR